MKKRVRSSLWGNSTLQKQKSNSIESGGKWHEEHSRPRWVAHVQRPQGKRVWRVSAQRKPVLPDSVLVGRGRQMPDYTE